MSTTQDTTNQNRPLRDQIASGASHVAEEAHDELARLRSQVEKLMQERVTPALGDAAEAVQDYAHRTRESIENKADSLASTVRDRPLTSVGVAAVAGYLLGHMLSGHSYTHPRDRR